MLNAKYVGKMLGELFKRGISHLITVKFLGTIHYKLIYFIIVK